MPLRNSRSEAAGKEVETVDEPVPAETANERKWIPVDSLLPPIVSVRAREINDEHARILAEDGDGFPPIVVHRASRRIIDGLHRVQAARLRGDVLIEVVFFDGAEEDAFVRAVELNHAHGLPLTLAERKSAAQRIVDSHPMWSDRRIARVVGLAASTVALLRSRCAAPAAAEHRIGRDGRSRPVDGVEGRRRAGELLTQHPDASLREVAKQAGVSVGTASDVRARLRRGEAAANAKQQASAEWRKTPVVSPTATSTRHTVLQILRKDPSLRFTEVGRDLLRLLEGCPSGVAQVSKIADGLPAHCRDTVIRLARESAVAWNQLADQVAGRPVKRSCSEAG